MLKRNSASIKQLCIFDRQYYSGQMTLRSTPQDFRFISLGFVMDQKEENLRLKADVQTQQNYHISSSVKYNSYRSITDLMEFQIKALIQAERKEQATEKKPFKGYLQQYQNMINRYFRIMFTIKFSTDSLKTIFGEGELNFGSTSVQKILQDTDLLTCQQKKILIQKLKAQGRIKKFLQIIAKDLSNELNLEYLLIVFEMLKYKEQKGELDFQILAQNYFYDSRIRYINLRFTKTDLISDSLKSSFQEFIYSFLELIFQISGSNDSFEQQKKVNQQFTTVSLKRFGLYSSKDDLLRSDDEESEFIFISRKKPHDCQQY